MFNIEIILANTLIRADIIEDREVAEVEFYIGDSLLSIGRNRSRAYSWETTDFPSGEYQLTVKAYDVAGNIGSDSIVVKLRDIVKIKEIMVVDEYDQTGGLEVEIHLFGAGVQACSGQINGLEKVDVSNTYYLVNAYFQESDGSVLRYDEVKAKNIYLEAIEDDTGPCPLRPNYNDGFYSDDLLGKSSTFPGNRLENPVVMDFGQVAHLKMARGRR